MSDIPSYQASPKPRLTKDDRPDIELPDGRILTPRVRLASELKVHEKTLTRRNPETVYIAGVAFVERSSVLNDFAHGLHRRNEPPRRRQRS